MSNWILLRGLMREARHWQDFPQQLQQALPDCVPVLLDLPGNGSQVHLESPLRIESMMEYCRTSLRQRGLAPPYHVLALSLGGMVACAWRAHYPQELAACVLINTSLRPLNRFYHRLRPHNYFALLQLPFLQQAPRRREQLVLALTSNRAQLRRAALDSFTQIQIDAPVARRNALRQLWAACRFRAPRCMNAVPTLLLASAGDRLVDLRCSQQIAQNWHATLRIHPTAGHDLALDEPVWLARQIADWSLPGTPPAPVTLQGLE